MPSFRLRELERIFESRYGWLLPDDDAGRGDLLIALNHIANTSGEVIAKMVGARGMNMLPRT